MIKISKIISTTLSKKITSKPKFTHEEAVRGLILPIFSIVSIILSLCLVKTTSHAAEMSVQSENSEITKNDPWKIQFWQGWKNENGSHQYGIFVDLADDWKTYWKHPGNFGFKPEFQILSSDNLKRFEILWPTPNIFYENKTEVYGFKSKLILPILIHPQEMNHPIAFELKMKLGFCEDICIPKTFHLKSVDAQITSGFQNSEIREFIKKVPIKLPTSTKHISCAVIKKDKNLILVSKLDNQFFSNEKKIEDAIFYYKGGNIWFTEKIQKLDEKTQSFITILNNSNNQSILLDRSKIELTLLTRTGGFILEGCPSP